MFVVAAAMCNVAAFVSHPALLLCEVAGSKTADWMYQTSEHSSRHEISVNGTTIMAHYGRFTVDGSSLIINEVKAIDAGIYSCGNGSQLHHKLRLNIFGV